MNETYLVHHGVKGMKWGVRKREDSLVTLGYVNNDGSLTAKGHERMNSANKDSVRAMKDAYKQAKRNGTKFDASMAKAAYSAEKKFRKQRINETTKQLKREKTAWERATTEFGHDRATAKKMVDKHMDKNIADLSTSMNETKRRQNQILYQLYK